MSELQQVARRFAAFSIIAATITCPAFAGVPVPGPVVGAGIPALAIIGAGYWLIRKRRKR